MVRAEFKKIIVKRVRKQMKRTNSRNVLACKELKAMAQSNGCAKTPTKCIGHTWRVYPGIWQYCETEMP